MDSMQTVEAPILCDWAEQVKLEIERSFHPGDNTSLATIVLNAVEIWYFFRMRRWSTLHDVLRYAYKSLPQEWHELLEAASQIGRGPESNSQCIGESRTRVPDVPREISVKDMKDLMAWIIRDMAEPFDSIT